METLTYRIDQFEGPLDLLLALIMKNKVSIEDIPIAMICDQYLDYLSHCKEMDMEIASDFLVMASELVLIKTRMLLPRVDENEEDPRATLAAALLEYQRVKNVAPMFSELYQTYSERLVKDTDEIPADNSILENQSVDRLFAAMNKVLSQIKPNESTERGAINPIIKKQIFPVSVKIDHITNTLLEEGRVTLYHLFESATSRSEIIATFIAVLELIKLGKIGICEETADSEDGTILLESIESGDEIVNEEEWK